MKNVTIYTDGSCSGKPGRGGYGAILLWGKECRELSGGFLKTTNNRMEIMAAIVSLKALKEKCQVILYSDSKYLVDTMAKGWIYRWKSNGWKRNKRDPVLNLDLWKQLLKLTTTHSVEFRWIKGHDGKEENERCDELAVQAAKASNLPEDTEYVLSVNPY